MKTLFSRIAIFGITAVLLISGFPGYARPNNQPARSSNQQTLDETSLFLPIIYNNVRSRPATISGVVYNAIEAGKPSVSDAQVCIEFTNICMMSDENGEYTFDNLVSGFLYTLIVTHPDFSVLERTIIAAPGLNEVDLPLSPIIEAGQFRIVLTWQADVDLDAHLWLPPASNYHITNVTGTNAGPGNCNTFPYACIDIDSLDGSLPESITVSDSQPGTYVYAVLHYDIASNPNFDGEPLDETGAIVDLYDEDGFVASFSPPVSTDDKAVWWYVFDLRDDGQLSLVNTISSTYPPGDYP